MRAVCEALCQIDRADKASFGLAKSRNPDLRAAIEELRSAFYVAVDHVVERAVTARDALLFVPTVWICHCACGRAWESRVADEPCPTKLEIRNERESP